jgi:antitoxin VapB
MAVNIKNSQVEQLVEEIAMMTGESKTEAIRQALLERRARLCNRVTPGRRRNRLQTFLDREVWSRVPRKQLGHAPDRAEREHILGYGEAGV